MSSKEIFIDPTIYDTEVDAFQTTTTEIASSNEIDVAAVKQKTILDSVDALEAIIESYKKCIDDYVELSSKDVRGMRKLKEQWVDADTMIANDIGGV